MTTMYDLFPNAKDWVNGHRGGRVITWYGEQDDDRTWLLKVPRYSHCNIPIGGDEYATPEEQEQYYKDQKEQSCV